MYKALYRKYRPLTFDDVISQPHITVTLKNQLVGEKTAHAYIFTGSRGTGKTTCARIFAKAVNCENPQNGEPCLECSICKDAELNALSDIIEIDAASNNGVDDVRDLRDGAVYTPERCKFKVFIIDEVHMLSTQAFNALLKILEEPPAHVKFILATTEIHKVMPTILSRCQRFDFRRILNNDIMNRLLAISAKEELTLERDAAELIARTSDGGMRDALSLLDQCAAFSDNINAEIVSEAAGIAGREYLFEIIQAVIEKNTAKAVSIIDKLYSQSKDMQKLCDELILQFRNVMMLKAVPSNTDVLVCMQSEIEMLKGFAEQMSLDEILSKLEILQKSVERLARSSVKRVETEMCIIRLCSSAVLSQPQSVPQPIQHQPVQQYAPVQQPTPQYTQPQTSPPPQTPSVAEHTETSQASNGQLTPLSGWLEVLEYFSKLSPSVSGTLSGSSAFEMGDTLFLLVQNPFFLQLFKKSENAEKLKEAIKHITGKTYATVKSKCANESNANISTPVQTSEPPVSSPLDSNKSPVERIVQKAEENNVLVELKQ